MYQIQGYQSMIETIRTEYKANKRLERLIQYGEYR